ncbi:hypothetical protein M432DRAFT_538797 [Thermoascus aurantiacus ATCC 26904]
MWKRMQIARSREPHIGNPTLIETTVDEKTLQTMKRVPGKRDDIAGGSKDSKNLPALPHKPLDPNASAGKPYAGSCVASSAYSPHDADQDNGYYKNQDLRYSDTYDSRSEHPDISPPDSPLHEALSKESPDVSPIDEEPNHPFKPVQKENGFNSHLPVLRKPTPGKTTDSSAPGGQSKNLPSDQRSSQMRWGDFSGEPATSDSGKAAQVTLGDTPFHKQSVSKATGTQHHSLFSKGKAQVLTRKKVVENRDQATKDDHAQIPPLREPWKGPSGRSAIVSPIQEKPGARPQLLTVDNRSSTARKPLPASPVLSAHLGFTPTTVTTITAGNTEKTVSQSIETPASGGRNASTTDGRPSPAISLVLSEDTTQEIKLFDHDFAAKLENVTLVDRPSSGYSATTTNSIPEAKSPRISTDIGTPRVSENLPSVMARGRPIPSAVAPLKSTTRKPTPSQASVSDTATSKALPQCPPEMKAQSRIDALEAKRDDLARRRANISSIIRELTQNSIAYDMAARNEVKKTIAILNDELADIKKQEHEIGVKLLRAWKRRDEEDLYGNGSGLWVRRVTS